MYPELFSIGTFSVSTFGVMLAIAFLVIYLILSMLFADERADVSAVMMHPTERTVQAAGATALSVQ